LQRADLAVLSFHAQPNRHIVFLLEQMLKSIAAIDRRF
jgi:hypothetical protein